MRELLASGLITGVVAFAPEEMRFPSEDRSQNVWERNRLVRSNRLGRTDGQLVFDVVRATAAAVPDDRFWAEALG